MSWLDEYAIKPRSIPRPTDTGYLTARLNQEPRHITDAIGFTADLTTTDEDEGD